MAQVKKLFEALQLSQTGDVDGALRVLEDAGEEGALSADGLGLQFMLLMRAGRSDEALDVCTVSIERFDKPLARSTWLLRRGLMYVDRERKRPALDDLQRVIMLDASDDHQRTAREALLRLAGMSAPN